MASTISAATLTVTHTEALTLNGVDRGVTNTLTIASVNEVDHRIVTVDTSADRTLVSLASTVGAGAFVNSSVKYIRVTNKDDTNYVTLGLECGSDDSAYIKLEAGQTFVIYNDNVQFAAANVAHGSVVFDALESITAKANTGNVDLELFVAST
tara:strand:+ start:258 stop:716 length:459 start_codon:yes stop_codon:yes gene_type:complete